MELLSNLVWLAVSALVLGTATAAVRRRVVRVSTGATLISAVLLCLLLLPVISMTDDLIESRQAALPLAAQSWHLAAEPASVGLEALALTGAFLLLLAFAEQAASAPARRQAARVWSCVAWLARAQRLRPPPAIA